MPGVFLDRDGVINEEVDLLCRPEQLRLIPGAPEGIRLLNERGLKVVVVTNQSVVARGLATPRQVVEIHRSLQRMLGNAGCRVNAFLYCPYHPHADLPAYRRSSADRKPGIGMLLKGAKRFRLDLNRSFLVGDRTSDIEAGRRAGCATVLVKTGHAGRDGEFPTAPDYICDDLLGAARLIVQELAA